MTQLRPHALTMKTRIYILKLATAATVTLIACITIVPACLHSLSGTKLSFAEASLTPVQQTSELEASLFVQDPRQPQNPGAIQVLWIPRPVEKFCLGKTTQECINVDYCIRTTNKNVPACRNSGVQIANLPVYPPGMHPKRVLSVVYFPAADMPGLDALRKFFAGAPKETLGHLSPAVRFTGKIKLTASPDDDQFELLQVLTVPRPE